MNLCPLVADRRVAIVLTSACRKDWTRDLRNIGVCGIGSARTPRVHTPASQRYKNGAGVRQRSSELPFRNRLNCRGVLRRWPLLRSISSWCHRPRTGLSHFAYGYLPFVIDSRTTRPSRYSPSTEASRRSGRGSPAARAVRPVAAVVGGLTTATRTPTREREPRKSQPRLSAAPAG
jgi:hypothetical protein